MTPRALRVRFGPESSPTLLHRALTVLVPREDLAYGEARGCSGNGRLDVWVHPTKTEALREGAKPAMACGMDEDDQARRHFGRGHWQKVLDRHEATHPEAHLLRVQTAFLQPAG
ncbi:hypothetical protein [Streptomyces yangpuensis]|uniref:hypothetical protein n=1 Tax=Streptomyces yangpuensis TaxID=1648182 RepID=UPI0038065513